ncbi:hypothetical protein A2U01_0036897, partial [Trifolium medium]|nr:hypothetical protein [Trifolium medium]
MQWNMISKKMEEKEMETESGGGTGVLWVFIFLFIEAFPLRHLGSSVNP